MSFSCLSLLPPQSQFSPFSYLSDVSYGPHSIRSKLLHPLWLKNSLLPGRFLGIVEKASAWGCSVILITNFTYFWHKLHRVSDISNRNVWVFSEVRGSKAVDISCASGRPGGWEGLCPSTICDNAPLWFLHGSSIMVFYPIHNFLHI